MSEIDTPTTEPETELARLLRENNFLRGLVSKLNIPCVYCSKENMAECPTGFPGCAQADDIMAADDEAIRSLLNRLKAEQDSALLNKMVIRYLHKHLPAGDPRLVKISQIVDSAHQQMNLLVLMDTLRIEEQAEELSSVDPIAGLEIPLALAPQENQTTVTP